MTAYFYKIKEKDTGKLYVGCQYSSKANPTNLLISYKTSCRYVRDRGTNAFEIVKVLIRTDAREFERRYLRRMYMSLGAKVFEQVFINRNLAPGIIFTVDIRKRMSDSLKRSAARRRAAGTLLPTFLGRTHTLDTKAKLSRKAKDRLRVRGHPRGMSGKHHDASTKEQIRQSGITNSAMRGRVGVDHPTGGTSWWNNGVTHKRVKECPGVDWMPGRIFKERNRNIDN